MTFCRALFVATLVVLAGCSSPFGAGSTTEALIHGYAPGAEPPVPLSTTVNASEWSRNSSGNRIGELATRIVLRTVTNDTFAAAGADGWGNDQLIELRNGDQTGYTWVLRWDDAANATEFVDHFRTYLDSRANRSEGLWRADDGTVFDVRRTSDRTTVVQFGVEAFVRATTVEGGTNVTVSAS